jgi:hypothetical protein
MTQTIKFVDLIDHGSPSRYLSGLALLVGSSYLEAWIAHSLHLRAQAAILAADYQCDRSKGRVHIVLSVIIG